jgi:hypothetical protein
MNILHIMVEALGTISGRITIEPEEESRDLLFVHFDHWVQFCYEAELLDYRTTLRTVISIHSLAHLHGAYYDVIFIKFLRVQRRDECPVRDRLYPIKSDARYDIIMLYVMKHDRGT